VQVHLSTHAPFNVSSIEAISAVGTVALALQYILPVFIIMVFRRYPERAKAALWVSMFVSCGSMLLSSFATKVRVFQYSFLDQELLIVQIGLAAYSSAGSPWWTFRSDTIHTGAFVVAGKLCSALLRIELM
jgi:amino acid transporter